MREPNKVYLGKFPEDTGRTSILPMELDPLLVHAEAGELELLKGEIEKVRF